MRQSRTKKARHWLVRAGGAIAGLAAIGYAASVARRWLQGDRPDPFDYQRGPAKVSGMAPSTVDPVQVEQSEAKISSLFGQEVHALDGENLGRVTAVYFDEPTLKPEWLEVTGGSISEHRLLVPVDETTEEDHELVVPYPKDIVESAPSWVEEELTTDMELALSQHYNRRRTVPSAENERAGEETRLKRRGTMPGPTTPLERV